MSSAAACEASSLRCTVQDIDGRMRSGVTVAMKMWSTSWTSRPAASSALRAASVAMSELSTPDSIMRRSRMPVRVTIHSSEVSTIFSRSAFDNTRSGRKLPVPAMVAPRVALGMGGSQEVEDVRVHLLLDEGRGRADRAADGARRRAAVADEDDAVDAEQRRAAVLGVVELLLQALEGGPHEERAELRLEVATDLLARALGNVADHGLGQLEHHVAGEAVGDDHVHLAPQDVPALDVADEVHVRRLGQQAVRLLAELVALARLLADRQETDAR